MSMAQPIAMQQQPDYKKHAQMYVQELLQKVTQLDGMDKMQEVKLHIRDAGKTGNKPLAELVRELTKNYAPELTVRWEDILRKSEAEKSAQRESGVPQGGAPAPTVPLFAIYLFWCLCLCVCLYVCFCRFTYACAHFYPDSCMYACVKVCMCV